MEMSAVSDVGDLAPSDSAATSIAEYVKDQLARQDVRKASFESRGLAVITTSGALVTLLFGLAALSTDAADTFTLPTSASALLAVAVVFFFAAAVTAMLTNVPLEYRGPETLKLKRLLRTKKELARLTRAEAERKNALTYLEMLEAAGARNEGKAQVLFWSVLFEVVAVALVAVAIGIVVSPGALWFSGAVAVVTVMGLYLRAYGLAKPREGPVADLLAAGLAALALERRADRELPKTPR